MCADSCRAAHAVGALPSTAEGGPGAEERVQEHTALTRWGGGEGREGERDGTGRISLMLHILHVFACTCTVVS